MIEFDKERLLVERLKNGDHSAFEAIYNLYKNQLIGNLLRILKSRDIVEEQVHDIFLNVWKGRDNIDPNKSFKAYLYTTAANMAKNVLRRAAYDIRMRSALLPIDQQVYTHVEERLDAMEAKQILDRILQQLPPQRRKVFTLCKLEGRSYKEVSELLDISENTVNDHIRKANATLKQLRVDSQIIGLLWLACLYSSTGTFVC